MKRPVAGLAVVITMLAATACGGSDSSDSEGLDAIKIGTIPIVDTAPVYIAEHRGYFEKYGIDAELVPLQGGASSIDGVVKGHYDFGYANVTSLLVAAEQGKPVTGVAGGAASTGTPQEDFSAVVVAKDSPKHSARDLEGSTVAVNQLQNIGDTTVRASVRKAGGDPDRVRFVEMPFAEMAAALDDGRVDATWVVEPYLREAVSRGSRPIAWNYVDTAPHMTISLYFTTTELAEKNPDLVKRFTSAMRDAQDFANAHPGDVRSVLGEYTKIPGPTLDNIVLPQWPEKINRSSVEQIARYAREDGLLKREADLDKLLP